MRAGHGEGGPECVMRDVRELGIVINVLRVCCGRSGGTSLHCALGSESRL